MNQEEIVDLIEPIMIGIDKGRPINLANITDAIHSKNVLQYVYQNGDTVKELEGLSTKVKKGINSTKQRNITLTPELNYTQLSKYIKENITIYPCFRDWDTSTRSYVYKHINYRDGSRKLKDPNGNKVGINSLDIIYKLLTRQLIIGDYSGRGHVIDMWRIFPGDAGLVIIDIDRHANADNGLDQWQRLVNNLGLTSYIDLESFPCYVETPHQGYHLYFKIPDGISAYDFKNNITSAIEIKTGNNSITAGGSVRLLDEYLNVGCYVLHGSIQNAPTLPESLLKVMLKPKTITYTKTSKNNLSESESWYSSIESIIETATRKANNNHDFVFRVSLYCAKANTNHGTHYNHKDVCTRLLATPQGQKVGYIEINRITTELIH